MTLPPDPKRSAPDLPPADPSPRAGVVYASPGVPAAKPGAGGAWWMVLVVLGAGALSFGAVWAVLWLRGPAPATRFGGDPLPSLPPPDRSLVPDLGSGFSPGQPALPDLALSSRGVVNKCQSNLRRIASGLQAYANRHDWRLPDRLEDLTAEQLLPPDALTCPLAAGTAANPSPPAGDDGPSYVYLGKGLTTPVDPDTVVLYEPARHYGRAGVHALFGDGSVRVLTGEDARQLVADAAAGRPVPYSATRPAAPDDEAGSATP